jgi:23S rRNA pseudouridine2605 synthase
MPAERLSKYLSTRGLASRRKCDELISAGRVKVNNVVVLEPFYRVAPDKDLVTVDNFNIKDKSAYLYIALYKPLRYLSDLAPEHGRGIARSLIPIETYLFPVGRLDYNSEGLIFFSNDGVFADRVMHPRYGVEKEYLVKFRGLLSEEVLQRVRKGIFVEGSLYRVKNIKFLKMSFSNSWYNIVLAEGKNRMIRKIGEAIHHPVLKLKRIRIGPVKLGSLQTGEYRFLSENEVRGFFK